MGACATRASPLVASRTRRGEQRKLSSRFVAHRRPRRRSAEPANAELADARPLRDNAFKVPLARNILVRTLLDLTGKEDQR